MTNAEWWGVAEAASHCGIQPGTWRDYVARGRAPQPDDPDEGAPKQRRRPRWRPDTVRAWQASRPRATPNRLRKGPRDAWTDGELAPQGNSPATTAPAASEAEAAAAALASAADMTSRASRRRVAQSGDRVVVTEGLHAGRVGGCRCDPPLARRGTPGGDGTAGHSGRWRGPATPGLRRRPAPRPRPPHHRGGDPMSGWYPMDRFTPGDGDAGEPPEHVNVVTGDPEMDEPEVWCDDCDGVNGHFPGCVSA